jgi:hypothetical protein
MKWDLEIMNDKFQNLGGTNNGWRKLKVWWVLGDAKIFHSYSSLKEGNTKYPWQVGDMGNN